MYETANEIEVFNVQSEVTILRHGKGIWTEQDVDLICRKEFVELKAIDKF